jgi:hypothetical protein
VPIGSGSVAKSSRNGLGASARNTPFQTTLLLGSRISAVCSDAPAAPAYAKPPPDSARPVGRPRKSPSATVDAGSMSCLKIVVDGSALAPLACPTSVQVASAKMPVALGSLAVGAAGVRPGKAKMSRSSPSCMSGIAVS